VRFAQGKSPDVGSRLRNADLRPTPQQSASIGVLSRSHQRPSDAMVRRFSGNEEATIVDLVFRSRNFHPGFRRPTPRSRPPDGISRPQRPKCLSKKAEISPNASLVSGTRSSNWYCACDSPSKTTSSASTPALRSLRCTRTVLLKSRSRVPVVRIAGGNPCMSPLTGDRRGSARSWPCA